MNLILYYILISIHYRRNNIIHHIEPFFLIIHLFFLLIKFHIIKIRICSHEYIEIK